MIDIGANLSNEQFNTSLDEVLKNAKSNGVDKIILTTTNNNSWNKNNEIIKKYENSYNLYTTWGLHPHYAKDFNVFKLTKPLNFNNIKAIGETGLDYFRMLSSKEDQINAFLFFAELAKEMEKPLFLHERNAFDDFYNIIKNYKNIKKVVHCFTGDKEQAKKYLDLNAYVGITGWITDIRRNKNLVEAVKYIPIEKILIETDAPYLTPWPISKKTRINEPANLNYILDEIVKIKKIDKLKAENQIKENTLSFFNLS